MKMKMKMKMKMMSMLPALTLPLAACSGNAPHIPSSTAFSRLSSTAYERSVDERGHTVIELRSPLHACGTTFPAGSRLVFTDSNLSDPGAVQATLASPITFEGRTYREGTEMNFHVRPKNTYQEESCKLFGIVLAHEESFGPHRFAPRDYLSGYKNGTFSKVLINSDRVVAGKSYQMGDELTLDPSGAVVSHTTRADRERERQAGGPAAANR